MNPRVSHVQATGDHKLHLSFANGEHGIFDCTYLLDLEVFRELSDMRYFRQVRVEYGTVTWPHKQDICPDTIYEGSDRNSTAARHRQSPSSDLSKVAEDKDHCGSA